LHPQTRSATPGGFDEPQYGKFGWVIDPEGNKVELWEPPPGQ
jgi:hypothetical protein